MLRHAGTCCDCKAEGVEARKIGRARTWTYKLLSSRLAIMTLASEGSQRISGVMGNVW